MSIGGGQMIGSEEKGKKAVGATVPGAAAPKRKLFSTLFSKFTKGNAN